MKKLILLLTLLLAIGMIHVFADVNFSGSLGAASVTSTDPLDSMGDAGNARFQASASADDFTSVTLDLRSDDDISGSIDINQFYAQSNILGALGVEAPVDVTLTFGRFEPWFTNWNAATMWHRHRNGEVTWSYGQKALGAVGVDIGFSGFTVKVWSDLGDDYGHVRFGLKGDEFVEGANFCIDFAMPLNPEEDVDEGTFTFDGAYGFSIGDISLKIPASISYVLATETIDYGVGVVFGISMLELQIQFGGMSNPDDSYIAQNLDAEVHVKAVENLDLYARGYMDFSGATGTETFQGVDVGLGYGLGALTLNAGYLAILQEGLTIPFVDADRYNQSASCIYISGFVSF